MWRYGSIFLLDGIMAISHLYPSDVGSNWNIIAQARCIGITVPSLIPLKCLITWFVFQNIYSDACWGIIGHSNKHESVI